MPDWWVRSDALRDLLVDTGRMPPPQRKFDLGEVEPGWLVYDRDVERIGRVRGRIGDYLIVQRWFRLWYVWFRLYIPATAIGDARQGSVFLNIPKAWLGSMDWGHPPRRPPTAWQSG
jgi:hypothetical protein